MRLGRCCSSADPVGTSARRRSTSVRAVPALAVACVAALATIRAGAATPEWASAPLAAPLPTGDYIGSTDDWVVVSEDVLVGVVAGGGLKVTHREVLASIGRKAANLVLAIDYDDSAERLTGPTIWVPGIFGRVALDSEKRRIDVADVDAEDVSALRRRFVSTAAIDPGKRVAVTWSIEQLAPFPGELVIIPVNFHPTASFTVRAESDAPLTLLSITPGAAPTQIGSGGFAISAVPAEKEIFVGKDPWRPAPIGAVPFVFATRSPADEITWPRLAQRTAALFSAASNDDALGSVAEKARELTSNARSVAEKIERLAAFSQSTVYRNIEWGIGAFRPDAPSEVLRSMSADCKAKVVLLQTLLRAIGVASTPVLARMSASYLGADVVPTAFAFNHVVLAIDAPREVGDAARLTAGPGAGWLLFDPTDELGSLRRAPIGLTGTFGLWVAPDGDRFDIATARDPEPLRADLTLQVLADQSARFDLTVSGEGGYASAARDNSMGGQVHERVQRYAQESLRLRVPGLTIDSVSFAAGDVAAVPPPELRLSGSIAAPLEPLAGNLYGLAAPTRIVAHALGVAPDGYRRDEPAPRTEAGRRWRVAACCSADARRFSGSVKLVLAKGWRVEQRPQMTGLRSPWLDGDVSVDGDVWTIEFAQKRGAFGSDSAQPRLDDWNALAKTLRSRFVLQRVAP